MTQEHIITLKKLVFPHGKITEELHYNFDDLETALAGYDECIKNPLAISVRLCDLERGQIIRRFVK